MREYKEPIFLKDLGMQYPTETSKEKTRYGLYKCGYCGKEFRVITNSVKRKNTKSCGCLHKASKTTHGLAKNKFYASWKHMTQRCDDIYNKNYDSYGGRGISVCEEWLDIKNFISWAEATHPNIEGYTLDRIDNDKGYSPNNCRWADKTTQAVNQRKNKNNKSGYVGVCFNKINKKWVARISNKHLAINLGTFKTIEEAVEARDNYIISNNLPHKLSSEYKQNNEPI